MKGLIQIIKLQSHNVTGSDLEGSVFYAVVNFLWLYWHL